MDNPVKAPGAADERKRRIDEMMAAPIKEPPAVTIFGDDDVTGYTPAPVRREPDGADRVGASSTDARPRG